MVTKMILEIKKLISHLVRFKQEIKKRKIKIKLFRLEHLIDENPNSSIEDLFENNKNEINKIKEDKKIDKELKENIIKMSKILKGIQKNE